MKGSFVSAELPNYLTNIYAPKRASRRMPKPMKTALMTGISQDSPTYFQGNFTRVFSSEEQAKEKLGSNYARGLVGSELKQAKVTLRRALHLTDIASS